MQDVAIPQHEMTVDEFLAWYERQPKEAGRFELWDGRIVEKHGGAGSANAERAGHARMKSQLFLALHAAMREAGIEGEVLPEGPQVKLGMRDRNAEPDVLVYLGPPVASDTIVVPNPIIVCEVLSPSTAKFDMTDKLAGYFELESLAHYIVADPDAPRLIHHQRGEGGTMITRCISDPATRLHLTPPGLSLDLSGVLALP